MFVVIMAQCITGCRMHEMDYRQTGAAGETDKDTTELPFHNFLSIVFSCCSQPCQLLFVSSLHMTCHQNRRIDQSTGVLARVVKEYKILARFDWGFYYTAFKISIYPIRSSASHQQQMIKDVPLNEKLALSIYNAGVGIKTPVCISYTNFFNNQCFRLFSFLRSIYP